MIDKFIDFFDGKTYDSIEEFDEDVSWLANDLEESLGRAERWARTHSHEALRDLGVYIKGVNSEEED